MRFKDFWVSKQGVDEPILLKGFSDGEHQLLHTLGLCLLFRNTKACSKRARDPFQPQLAITIYLAIARML